MGIGPSLAGKPFESAVVFEPAGVADVELLARLLIPEPVLLFGFGLRPELVVAFGAVVVVVKRATVGELQQNVRVALRWGAPADEVLASKLTQLREQRLAFLRGEQPHAVARDCLVSRADPELRQCAIDVAERVAPLRRAAYVDGVLRDVRSALVKDLRHTDSLWL